MGGKTDKDNMSESESEVEASPEQVISDSEFAIEDKIVLSAVKRAAQERKLIEPIVILVTTGSFNPPHRFHVECFNRAAAHIEENKLGTVVLSLFVPASDRYVRGKLGKHAIPFTHRKAMLDMLVKELGRPGLTVEVSKAEVLGMFYSEVIEFYQKRFAGKLPGRKVRVVYCCGSDHGNHVEHNQVFRRSGVYVITRPQFPSNYHSTATASPSSSSPVSSSSTTASSTDSESTSLRPTRPAPAWMVVLPGSETEVSSSAIRKCDDLQDAHALTSPSVVEYLRTHDLLKRA